MTNVTGDRVHGVFSIELRGLLAPAQRRPHYYTIVAGIVAPQQTLHTPPFTLPGKCIAASLPSVNSLTLLVA